MINKQAIETAVKHMRSLRNFNDLAAAAQLFAAMCKAQGVAKGYHGWTKHPRYVVAVVNSGLALYKLKDYQPTFTPLDDGYVAPPEQRRQDYRLRGRPANIADPARRAS